MRNETTKVSIFGAVLIVLMLYASMTISAQPHFVDGGYMETEASNGAPIAYAVAYDDEVDVTVEGEVGPDLQINVTCSASDISSGGSYGSYHRFNLTVEFLGSYKYDEWITTVSPPDDKSHTLHVVYKDVQENQEYDTTLYCYVLDYDTWFWDEDTDWGQITTT